MRNLISGNTLHYFQLMLGVKEGLESFTCRCTGRTRGHALGLISEAMTNGSADLGSLRGNLGYAEVGLLKLEIIKSLDQMQLVGFSWAEDVLLYYPFEEFQDVKEIIREVEIQVSPYDGPAISPRSYGFVEHSEGPEVGLGGVEQSVQPLCPSPYDLLAVR